MFSRIFLMFLFGLTCVFADDIYSINNEPGKLYVRTGNIMLASTKQLEELLTNRGGNRLVNSKNWRCYFGNKEIMEHEFFEIAGFNEQASEALNHMKFQKSLDVAGTTIGGTSCLVSGLALCMMLVESLSGSLTSTKEKNYYTVVFIGLGGTGLGLSLGIVRFLKRGKKNTLGIAVEAADKFNKQ